MSDLQQRLRRAADTLRRTSMPLADLIPLLQQAADALEAQPAQAVPLLTEREIVKCLTASGCVGTVKMSYDSGPYEITRTSVNADRFARAIESLVRSKLGATFAPIRASKGQQP